ncbi:MAG: FAD:protein FMN transferase [Anaerovoracaceae bacterium]|nr:FAD:protein FMN transferase [Bacillota bacterium]MEE0516772.1 FAD:protein FMN transferase [Anaerovoracaceae bacterium]
MKKKFIILFFIVMLIIPQIGCKSQNNNAGIEKSSFHLDTICKITVYSMEGIEELDEKEQRQEVLSLITEAFKLCDDYEKILSKTKEETDIYRINHAGGKAVEVSDVAIEVIKKGLEYGEISGGAFDITIGAVTDMWDFHGSDEEGNKTGTVPDRTELSEKASHVDYRNIIIDGNTVRLADPEVQIDLGGIAKGYIADKLAGFLEENGVTSAIVYLGGNIVVVGEKGESLTNSNGTMFEVGIGDPSSEMGELLGTVSCKDMTVVTSGTYERYFEADGKKYHHVLDPETGFPVDTDLLSVTVISEKGRSQDCDGLSTVCLALGKEKGTELIKSIDGFDAIFVDTDNKVTVTSDDMDFKLR